MHGGWLKLKQLANQRKRQPQVTQIVGDLLLTDGDGLGSLVPLARRQVQESLSLPHGPIRQVRILMQGLALRLGSC